MSGPCVEQAPGYTWKSTIGAETSFPKLFFLKTFLFLFPFLIERRSLIFFYLFIVAIQNLKSRFCFWSLRLQMTSPTLGLMDRPLKQKKRYEQKRNLGKSYFLFTFIYFYICYSVYGLDLVSFLSFWRGIFLHRGTLELRRTRVYRSIAFLNHVL